ncbi:chromate transporter [Massilia sp. TS11]|uniref:chromate transporter n=1 Tax=Massilia sp. TS11 TaxID=2908003 RepID=UPI001EDA2D5D|nr:chromate transporter [Massilia sp. TS11]MCG2584004.1 chromate transporter [Massilia sp. TS11]
MTSPAQRPASLRDLYWSFTFLALQGFGGVLAIVQRELVERKHWLTQEEFVEEWAVAQVMPGPNVINLSMMIGARYFGWRGAGVALAGMLSLPLLIVLVLAAVFAQFAGQPAVEGALRGMAAVSAGMVAAAGLKLLPTLARNPIPRPLALAIAALGFICTALWRLPIGYALLGLGGLGCLIAYRRLRA